MKKLTGVCFVVICGTSNHDVDVTAVLFSSENSMSEAAQRDYQNINEAHLRKLPIISMNNLGSNPSATSMKLLMRYCPSQSLDLYR